MLYINKIILIFYIQRKLTSVNLIVIENIQITGLMIIETIIIVYLNRNTLVYMNIFVTILTVIRIKRRHGKVCDIIASMSFPIKVN